MDENAVTVREARAHLADHIHRAEQGTPTVITRNGVPVAAVVPIGDFDALEKPPTSCRPGRQRPS
jgi:prevent-host-death family protein